MTKRQRVEKMLSAEGFDTSGDFRVVVGPKVKSDILEAWSVGAWHNGKHVMIHSANTMTELVKRGLTVERNTPETCLYGDYVAYPKPK